MIIKKISNGECSKKELFELMESNHPLIIYHVLHQIGELEYKDDKIVEKLVSISNKRDFSKYKIIGIYTIGDLAMATLMKLRINLNDLEEYIKLSSVEKEDILNLFKEIW